MARSVFSVPYNKNLIFHALNKINTVANMKNIFSANLLAHKICLEMNKV